MQRLSEFLCGLLFGIGLVVTGMSDPGKILGFLDVTGAWDPSLLLVMCGAVAVGLVAFALARRRTVAFFGGMMQIPTSTAIDRPLVVGSLLFGVGWGLAGFCPGPALVAAGAGYPKALVFTLAMVLGMALQKAWARRSSGA